jgi:tetratricopeptide (TPR) repeat protein
MKRNLILFHLLLIALFIFPGCAPYKMKAIRAQRDQRYDLSIKFALKHLNSHPNDRSAIDILNHAAQGYYDDLQQKIQHFEKLDDWDTVVKIADQGYQVLSDATKVVGANFPTKEQLNYLQSKSQQSKLKQADELYNEALKLYQDKDYLEALTKFKQVEFYARHFKDTDKLITDANQKLASREYQDARDLLNQGRLEEAISGFERTIEFVPNFLDAQYQIDQAKAQLAEKYYNEGQSLFNAGDYKNAYYILQKTLTYQPDHSSAKNLFDETKEKLTVRLAVFPFSSSKLDQKFGGIASQNLLARALPQKSDFIMFLEREYLQKIFEEQALSQTGAIDEKTAVQVGKISGVNTIVVGSVTLVSQKTSGPTRRTLTGYFDKKYRDPKGVQRTKKEPFNYTVYDVERSVEVNLSYRLISVETGNILFNESITEPISDNAEWITCSKEFVKYLSSSEQQKMKASKEPGSMESLINQAINSLTDQAAAKIIRQVAPF